jgi:hypothetical protein
MNTRHLIALSTAATFVAAFCCSPSRSQDPVTVLAPAVVDTAAAIVVKSKKPKPAGQAKFEGFVVHANIAQITVRAKGNDLAIRTFPLSPAAAAKMQQIIDKGGYQYGDKVTVLYDATTEQALKVKGKPSKPI